MFFRQITEAFLVRTDPDSSIVNPGAHPHHQSAPDQERERVEDELRLLLRTRGVRRHGGGGEQNGGRSTRVHTMRPIAQESVCSWT